MIAQLSGTQQSIVLVINEEEPLMSKFADIKGFVFDLDGVIADYVRLSLTSLASISWRVGRCLEWRTCR